MHQYTTTVNKFSFQLKQNLIFVPNMVNGETSKMKSTVTMFCIPMKFNFRPMLSFCTCYRKVH